MALRTSLLLLLTLFSVCLSQHSDLRNCKYTSTSGKVFDLSPLISKDAEGYMWNQTVLETPNNLYTNPDFSNPLNLSFQLQICRNISKAAHNECNATSISPIYMYDSSIKKCFALGSTATATFNPNRLMDGVYLDYYDGEAVNHIVRYEARVYFVCDPNVTISGPLFEHMKESYQAHFHIFTKLAC